MKSAFLMDLRVYRDYLRSNLRVVLIVCIFEILALQYLAPVPGLIGIMYLIGCAQTGLANDSSGWEQARLTLPLSRRQVVYGRFGAATLVGFGAALVGMVVCLVVGFVASNVDALAERFAALALTPQNLVVMVLSTATMMMIGCFMLGVLLTVGFKLGMTKTTQMLPIILLMITIVPLILVSALGMMGNLSVGALASWLDALFNGLYLNPLTLSLVCLGLVGLGLVFLAVIAQLAAKFYEARNL